MATTDTLALSRRIIVAIDPDGTRWPEWQDRRVFPGIPPGYFLACTAPDLSLPENLHHAYTVADAAGDTPCHVRPDYDDPSRFVAIIYTGIGPHVGTGATRNLALMDAVALAKGVER